MNWHKLTTRICILAILAAMLLRYAGSGLSGDNGGFFSQPALASFLIYSESGRKPTPTESSSTAGTQPSTTEATTPETEPPVSEPEPTIPETVPQPSVPPVSYATFAAADTAYLEISYSCSYRPDTQKLLLQKLTWDLTGDEPTVLIIHSHGTEAYTQTADSRYEGHAAYRTTDTQYNMISIGDELTRLLQENGLNVLHDRTAHDYLDYDNAYQKSRAAVQAYLKEYPSIKLVLDLHRDAITNADGTQYAPTTIINGQSSAQLMFVVGTDASGDKHSKWQTNLSIAEKLHVLSEKNADGLCRPINLRSKAYNQDLSVGSLLVEVGAAGNTHAEAINAMTPLATAILQLVHGTT